MQEEGKQEAVGIRKAGIGKKIKQEAGKHNTDERKQEEGRGNKERGGRKQEAGRREERKREEEKQEAG